MVKGISSSSQGMTKNVMDFDNLGNDDLAVRCRNSKAKTGSFEQTSTEGKQLMCLSTKSKVVDNNALEKL